MHSKSRKPFFAEKLNSIRALWFLSLWHAVALCRRSLRFFTGQGQQLPTEEEIEPLEAQCSSTEEELEPQCLATEEGSDVVIPELQPQERFLLPNIWKESALKQMVVRMIACFERSATRAIHHSPVASYSSSPLRYEYDYRSASPNSENVDRHPSVVPFHVLDGEDVDLIDSDSLDQLDDMMHQLADPYKFFSDNSGVLYSYLYDLFTSAGFFIDNWIHMDATDFTDQSANDCGMTLRITTRLLCLMWNKLAEAACESFDEDLRGYYFVLCARGTVENIIMAADSISNLEWPASHIYQMLVLYRAIGDIIPAIDCRSVSVRIEQQMQNNFKGIFDCIKRNILDILNGPQGTLSQVEHPVTKFLIRSMKLFASHSQTVQDTCVANDCSLGHHLSDLIRYWAEQLRTQFISYTDGRNYLFILNNLAHFYEETIESLKKLMPNSYPNNELGSILKELIATSTLNYLVECWACVKLISGVQPCRSSLDAFTSQFKIVYERQRIWVVQTQLKRKLRQQIEEFLVPHYDTSLKKVQKRPSSWFKTLVQKCSAGQHAKYMSTEELKYALNKIFESEYNK